MDKAPLICAYIIMGILTFLCCVGIWEACCYIYNHLLIGWH